MAECNICRLFVLILILCIISLIRTETNIPVNETTLDELATYVCSELVSQEEMDGCQIKFTSENRNLTGPMSQLQVLCQSKRSVTFSITPLPTLQLVVLMPDDQDPELIRYIVVDENEEIVTMSSIDPGKYTFWTTVLNDDLSPSLWLRGANINIGGKPKKKPYHIKYSFLNVNNKVSAIFTWNASSDFCFEVINYCNKLKLGDFFQKKLTFADKQRVQVIDLPFEDKCTFRVSGLYGTSEQKYNTPSCDDLDGCNYNWLPPEIPKNISLYAKESTNGTWTVFVNWQPPKHNPKHYNITIRTSNESRTIQVSGNATEMTFEDVVGNGLYNVSVLAITSVANAHSAARAIFPTTMVEEPQYSTSLLTAEVLCAALLAAIAAIGAVLWWRRRRARTLLHLYFQGLEDKLPKDYGSDTGGPESGIEDSWEIRPERLLLQEVIGEGAFGVVRRGTLGSLSGDKEVAVKMLKEFPSVEEIRSFRAEMELMKSVGAHPHVVSLVGCCSGRRPLIVAQYCSRGDLLSYLRCCWDVMVSKRNAIYYNNNIESSDYRNDLFKNKSKLSKLVVNKLYDLNGVCDPELTSVDLLSFCRQIAMGMEFLASNRVVHRDLAARNVLVSGDRTLKIADFGLSRDIYQDNQYKQKGNGKMPIKWMALESLTHRIYTTQSDVWSFGVVVWEIVTVGGSPYPEVPAARLPRLLRAGYRMPRPNNCSKQLYEVMVSCWRARPRERPTFAELHRELDALLNSACADHYLSLELDADDTPSTPLAQRYIKIITRCKRPWTRGESYERPLKAPQSNHYTSPPAILTRP